MKDNREVVRGGLRVRQACRGEQRDAPDLDNDPELVFGKALRLAGSEDHLVKHVPGQLVYPLPNQ